MARCRIRWIAGLVIALSACQSGAPAFSTAHKDAMVDSVGTMLTAWRAAMNARDGAKVAAFYSNDPAFRWFEDGEIRYRSGKEIGAAISQMAITVKTFDITLIEPQITALAPGVAVLTTNFAQKLTDTSNTTIGIAGAISATIVHADSGWRFLVGHTSALPPPTDTVAAKRLHRT